MKNIQQFDIRSIRVIARHRTANAILRWGAGKSAIEMVGKND
jgi:hypothetical protein